MMSSILTFESWFRQFEPNVTDQSIHAILELKAEGSTIPFIARYRKEKTGNANEVIIQRVFDLKDEWDELVGRQAYIVSEIEKQGKLTAELKTQILTTYDRNILEDIYLPFKPKRRSKATQAREAGLEPLADWIWGVAQKTVVPEPGQTLELWAFTFKNEEKGYTDAAACIAGAMDILVERLSENLELRQQVRDLFKSRGHLRSIKGQKPKPNSKFENYFDYDEKLSSLLEPKASHRYLAIRRGWIEEELSISFGGSKTDLQFEEDVANVFYKAAGVGESTPELKPVMETLEKAARLACKAHVVPSIENEFHKSLKEAADQVAIGVFSENVRKILLGAPYGPKAVLGVDPGVRTGCKLALIDSSGKFVRDSVVKLQSDSEKEQAKILFQALAESGQVTAIVVGNGTAGRETEAFIRQSLKEKDLKLPVVMVSEAGASVYSASIVAREEFPDLDVTIRGAISIARRFQDPLAELVKIDPKSIGVGQYQHDVSQTALKRALDYVVDSCVNSVGVNLNTGSIHLLSHVSGIGEGLAKSVVEYREKNGLFKSREEVKKVSRFSDKTFQLAAGFLRVPESDNPLDNTGVHPERYADLEAIAKKMGKEVTTLIGSGARELSKIEEAKSRLGEFTLKDVIKELEKPGRDPRDQFVPVSFREDFNELKDVQEGMICPGVVTNVTNFGAFVDIGVHQDGLVHISQLGHKFVSDPQTVVSPGDRVQVKVLGVDLEKKQLSLTMKLTEKPETRRAGSQANLEPKKLVVSYEGDSARPKPNLRQPPVARPAPTPSGPSKIKPKQTEVFNNPFGSLAALKSNLKK